MSKTDRIGVLKTGEYFARAGWLFREQPIHDYGIDAQVEIADGDSATGALIGIQIKSGRSYFSEQTDRSIVFRSTDRHIKYWLRHCLPVIVVLYDDERNALYWEAISETTIKRTGEHWRVDIPKESVLSPGSLDKLRALTQPPPYIQRLNALRLDRVWIDLIAQGEIVYIQFQDWVNKSLPRFKVEIGCDTRRDIASQEWPTTYGPGLSFEDLLAHLLPWADFETDEHAYEIFMEAKWMSDCYLGQDRETGETYYSMTFEEYYTPPDGIAPVSANGETDSYRLIVSLNELGKAFVVVDHYLCEEDDFEGRTFTSGW